MAPALSRWSLLLAILTVIAVSLPVSAATAATGSISGTVTDAATHEPIAGIEVCATLLEEEGGSTCATTGLSGTYLISGLVEGQYKVGYWSEEFTYAFQFYNGKPYWYEADPVTVGAGDTPNIDAHLVANGQIEGTVRAEAGGAPIQWVEVCAWELSGEEEGGCTGTNAEGKYTIPGLGPGEYGVEFGPESGGFLHQVFDHKLRWSEAEPVTVVSGQATTGIDADLMLGAEIAGTVTSASSGLPLPGIIVCAVEAASGELWDCASTAAGGSYTVGYLPPGDYKVVFSLEWSEFFPGEKNDPDEFLTQFWNGQATLAAANAIHLAVGGSVTGVDGHLTSSRVVPPIVPPALPAPAPVTPKKLHCKRGFKLKKVHGKRRCVRVHRRHGHRGSGRVRPLHRP